MNFSRSFFLVAALAAVGTLQAGWNRLPYAETRSVDLAAKAMPGTRLLSSVGLGNAACLIDSSLNEAVSLNAGRSSAVLQLSSQQNVHTVSFNNDGAEGKVSIGGSVDNKDWSNLGSAVFSSAERVAQVHFGTATIKYLSVSFESVKGGTIRCFEVLGTSTERDYELVAGAANVNLASAVSGARPIFAFPTPGNVGELNYLHNVFQFPKSHDKYRTIVYDLGERRSLKHFATSHSQRPVRVEVYAFDELPQKKDWRGKLTLDPAIFQGVEPVAVGEDATGAGHIQITPKNAVQANYIALRFEQNYQQHDAVALFNLGLQNLMAAAAGPFAPLLEQVREMPEFRFAKGQAAGSEDLTVGGVEFDSESRYQIALNATPGLREDTLVLLNTVGGSPTGSAKAVASSASVGASAMAYQSAVTNNNSQAAAAKTQTVQTAQAKTKEPTPTAPAAKVASNTVAANPYVAGAYVAGATTASDSKLEKSFSSKLDSSKSNKGNDHGGGGDDDDDDGGGGGGGGGDHGDHGDDHGPPHSP